MAVGFAPTERLRPTATAYAAQRELVSSEDIESRSRPRIALMRHAYVAETDERALDEVTDDLVRLQELQSQPHGSHGHAPVGDAHEGSRADRRETARASAEALVRDEIMILGGPELVATALRQAQAALSLDLFLANVYAMGVEQERVRRTLRLLTTEVAPRLRERPAGKASG